MRIKVKKRYDVWRKEFAFWPTKIGTVVIWLEHFKQKEIDNTGCMGGPRIYERELLNTPNEVA